MQDYKSKSMTLVHGVIAAGECAKLKLDKASHVVLCEGRPSLEAGRGNAGAFLKAGVIPTVICDNMAGFLFYKGLVKELFLSVQYADKTGALCDCGALIYAVLAKRHGVPVRLIQGERKSRFLGDPKDILSFEGKQIADPGTKGYVPLVEWVPAAYIN